MLRDFKFYKTANNNNQEHKEEILEKRREYQQNNAGKIADRKSSKVECGCGSKVTRGNIHVHRRTEKHKDWEKNEAKKAC